MKMNLKFQD